MLKCKVYVTAGLHLDPTALSHQEDCLLYMFDISFGNTTVLKIFIYFDKPLHMSVSVITMT